LEQADPKNGQENPDPPNEISQNDEPEQEDQASTDQKPNLCKYCQQHFPSRKKLKTHNCSTRQSILCNQYFVCSICGKSLLQSSFTYHMTTHSSRTPSFKCQEENCEKSFYTNQHLKQHQKSHSKEFPFACPHCDKKFVQKHHQVLEFFRELENFLTSLFQKSEIFDVFLTFNFLIFPIG
jgi:hypothetical protein